MIKCGWLNNRDIGQEIPTDKFPITNTIFDLICIGEKEELKKCEVFFVHKFDKQEIPKFNEYINYAKSIDIPIVYFDLFFPFICEYEDDYDFVVTETSHKNQKDNIIGIPILGLHNFKKLTGNFEPNASQILAELYKPELIEREYNMFLRVGKLSGKSIRQRTLYEYLSLPFENAGHIVSLPEISNERREKEKTELFNDINEINKFDINFTDYKEGQGAVYKGNPNTWFHDNCNIFNKIGVYSIFSYAEIMFESVTTHDTYIKQNDEIISFTEKHLQLFATLTIPLIMDNEQSINYLKKWGFEFFEADLKPLVTDKTFITEKNNKIKSWLEKLVNYDFKDIWHKDLSQGFRPSILLNNFNRIHDIYNRGLHFTLTEYKILEALNHPYLEKFQWDTNVRYLKQNDLL